MPAGWPDTDPAVRWLLDSPEPAVRYRTLTEVLGRPDDDPAVRAERVLIIDGPKVREIFAAQNADGSWGDPGFGRKYTGTAHVLGVLSQLRVPGTDPRLTPGIDFFLSWLTPTRNRVATTIDGRLRYHVGTREGVALDMYCLFGLARDPRATAIVDFLLSAQWPDGGWNCDKKPTAHNSSFIETFDATRGLFRYHEATGDQRALDAALASTDIFLRRGIIRSERTGNLISGRLLQLHWPRGYDMLFALEALAPGGLDDPRLAEALDLLESRRGKQGHWRANGPKPRVGRDGPGEVADFCDGTRDAMVTLRALAVLRAAGRVTVQRSSRPHAAVRRPARRSRAETLGALLADAGLDLEVASIEPLNRDEDGAYSRVLLDDGSRYILREYATTTSGADYYRMKEAALFASLRAAGLPTPRALSAVEGSGGAGGDAAAMLLDDAGGRPLAFDGRWGRPDDLFVAVSGARRNALWSEVGAMLRRLHDTDLSYAGPLAAPKLQADSLKRFMSKLAEKLRHVQERHPSTRRPLEEVLKLGPRIRDYLQSRPRAIRFGDGYYLPTMLLDENGGRFTCRAWLSWGYYARVGDPMRDIVGIEHIHREWTGRELPASFYKAYGRRTDPVCEIIYGAHQRHWDFGSGKETLRMHQIGAVPPYPTAPDAIQELPATVDRLKTLLA